MTGSSWHFLGTMKSMRISLSWPNESQHERLSTLVRWNTPLVDGVRRVAGNLTPQPKERLVTRVPTATRILAET